MNRRRFLGALGGTSAALTTTTTVAATAKQATNEVCINAADESHPYKFAVSGEVEQVDTAQADIPANQVTSDPSDQITAGCMVHGATKNGWDVYRYTGEILAFNFYYEASGYTVLVNGQQRTARDLPTNIGVFEAVCASKGEQSQSTSQPEVDVDVPADQQPSREGATADVLYRLATSEQRISVSGTPIAREEFCPLDNTLEVGALQRAKQPVTFHVSVDGEIELENGQRVQHINGKIENGGGVSPEMDFPYSGTITAFDVSGPAYVNTEQSNPCE